MSATWAILLAGGGGTRLQSMTRAITGDNRPKQFVPYSVSGAVGVIPSSTTFSGWTFTASIATSTCDMNSSSSAKKWSEGNSATIAFGDFVATFSRSDLGEPNRVLSTLAHLGVQSQLAVSAS